EELKYFYNLINKIGCPLIDFSDKAIEETANELMYIIEQNKSNQSK
ncbi:phosphoenolpyruvate synthase regulatory protein, partial [Staphylococcus condimenti]